MTENLTYVLAIFGGVCLCIAIITLLWLLSNIVGDKLSKAKIKRQIKHRFDKPPKAKCYCVDCYYYEPYEAAGSTTGECFFNKNRVFNDNHFCAMAKPATNSRR